jgi:hypothetical protein
MNLRRRGYLAENIRHRELSFGQESHVNLHINTLMALTKEMESYSGAKKKVCQVAIDDHKEALNLFRNLGKGKLLVREIRAAKKAAKRAHLLVRKI